MPAQVHLGAVPDTTHPSVAQAGCPFGERQASGGYQGFGCVLLALQDGDGVLELSDWGGSAKPTAG